MLDETQEEEEEDEKEDTCNEKRRWTKKIMLDEMQEEEEEEDKCRLRKKKEEDKYDKNKLSKLGRSVFEPTFQEMSKLRREIVQNREKCGYSLRNVTT